MGLVVCKWHVGRMMMHNASSFQVDKQGAITGQQNDSDVAFHAQATVLNYCCLTPADL